MKYCNKCNVNITGKNKVCPLCKNTLNKIDEEIIVFPTIPTIYKQYSVFFKILMFLSSVICFLSLSINYLINRNFHWSIFVIGGIVCFWLSLITAIKKRNNISLLLFYELILISIGSIVWDYFTGWHLWSITYVLPFICLSTIITMVIVSLVLKYTIQDYFIYIWCEGIIGVIPLLLIITKVIKVYWPSICCIILSIIALLAITIFSSQKGLEELKRRFHI